MDGLIQIIFSLICFAAIIANAFRSKGKSADMDAGKEQRNTGGDGESVPESEILRRFLMDIARPEDAEPAPEPVLEPVSVPKPEAAPKPAPEEHILEEEPVPERKKLVDGTDKRKLIIYSELMKPKFDEL